MEAATGALLTGWVLIGTLGFAITVYAAAALNFVIGGSAYLFSGRLSRLGPRSTGLITARGGDETRRRLVLWSAMVFASGFLAISLEIVWFRVFGTLMRSDESRPQESEQGDKWSFCLRAGTVCPANQERQ